MRFLMDLKGAFTAMITPFKGAELDEKGLLQNIQSQIQAGIKGLVLLGTTGEAMTLTEEEQTKVIEIGVGEGKGKSHIIVGTGSNCTKTTIEKTKKAKELGADCALIVTPYYNKPTQEGIYRHFQAITAAVEIPILVYNNPSRSGVCIETSTLLKIAKLPQIMGVKESSGKIQNTDAILQTVSREHPSFIVLSGEDTLTFPMMMLGAHGVISVVSNLVPEKIVSLVEACLNDQLIEARKIHHELFPIYQMASLETNPIPIKQAMNLSNLPAGECRLPLCEMKLENREKLENFLFETSLKEC